MSDITKILETIDSMRELADEDKLASKISELNNFIEVEFEENRLTRADLVVIVTRFKDIAINHPYYKLDVEFLNMDNLIGKVKLNPIKIPKI